MEGADGWSGVAACGMCRISSGCNVGGVDGLLQLPLSSASITAELSVQSNSAPARLATFVPDVTRPSASPMIRTARPAGARELGWERSANCDMLRLLVAGDL